MNVIITTQPARRTAQIKLLYPAIYTFSCRLDISNFPFDKQSCTMTFSSWTFDSGTIDYYPARTTDMISSYTPNEGWQLLNFTGASVCAVHPGMSAAHRESIKYGCCPNPYVLVHYTMVMRRKPLFYIANLILPTAIITMIALVGFFMPSNAEGERVEKVTLGITTLLSMSILLLMVSDSMPTTSSYIPLIGTRCPPLLSVPTPTYRSLLSVYDHTHLDRHYVFVVDHRATKTRHLRPTVVGVCAMCDHWVKQVDGHTTANELHKESSVGSK
jgi:nicotinic acetylcholine receptor